MDKSEIEFVVYGRRKLEGEWYMGSRVVNRLYFVHGGEGWYIRDGKKHMFRPNCLYFFPSNVNIKLENNLKNPIDHTYFDFIMCPALIMDGEIEISYEESPVLKSAVEAASELIKRCGSMQNANDNENHIVESYFRSILYFLDEIHPFKRISDERINNAVLYIHKNYDKDISVQTLAADVFMETNHFIKVFKKQMCVSPYQYIKDYRFSVAYTMLKNGVRVGAVSKRTGFSSVSAFSNAYKKKYGIYPGEVCKKTK